MSPSISEPARLVYDCVELVAVDDKKAPAVRGAVNHSKANFKGPKRSAGESAYLGVVIAGDVDEARAVLGLREQLLDSLRFATTRQLGPRRKRQKSMMSPTR